MTPAQKNAYLEAHRAVQQHMAQSALQNTSHIIMNPQQNAVSQHHTFVKLAKDTQQLTSITSNVDQHAQHQISISSTNPPPLVSTVVQQYISSIKVPQINTSIVTSASNENTFTVPDDGNMGYEGGVKVLQSLGNWAPEIPMNIPKPNLIPFTEPYTEGKYMTQTIFIKCYNFV